MASVYRSQGDYSKALQYHEKSLNMDLNIYGHTDHPSIAASYNNIARIYHSQGDYSKALQYSEKSLRMKLAVYRTVPHSQIAESYLHLGDVSMSLSDFSSVVRYYQESLSSLKQLYCDAEKVEFLWGYEQLLTACYFDWYSDCGGD